MMRTLLAVFAAFFAGLWLNERTHRQKAEARLAAQLAAQLAAVPAPKPVDRRHVSELIPELKISIDMFDTKRTLMRHFSEIVWKAETMELTPMQFHDLGSDLIAIASTLSDWDHTQYLKERYPDV
ncbi:MAG: hypothetical protein SF029_13105 [bacterium]|nr:hypothetical protein [bacterium]